MRGVALRGILLAPSASLSASLVYADVTPPPVPTKPVRVVPTLPKLPPPLPATAVIDRVEHVDDDIMRWQDV